MAASSSDYFLKATPNFSTTISSGGVADGTTTTIPLAGVSNLPTDTGIELVINRVNSSGVVTNNYETVRGVISGSNLTSCVRGVEGTAQAWDAGTTVEYLATADIQNRMVTGILVEHGQDGTHSDMTSHITAASTSVSGKIEVATSAETTTGTDATRAVSPDGLSGSDYGKRVFSIEVFAPDVDCSTGDGKKYIRIPSILNGYNLVGVAAQVVTAGTTGTMDIQIANVTDSHDMLSTKMTIDSTEKDTATAATAAVINTSYDDVATADQLRIDMDAVHTTAAKGLVVEMTFQLP